MRIDPCLLIKIFFAKIPYKVHRDLKPNNIFISNINGKVVAKIGDYGSLLL